MKALILSLVIAFSSSFALACTQSNGSLGWNGHEGKLAPPVPYQQNSVPVLTAEGKQGKRTT
jgi:hypothetical protein